MTLTLSPEQQTVCDAVVNTTDNLLISACAGGAKTTTLCEAARALGPGRSILFLAFNKDIATTLQARIPYYANASTFHSHCYDALGKFLKYSPRADANRTKWALKEKVPDWKARREVEEAVLTLVSRAKSCGFNPTSTECEQTLQEVADAFNIDAGVRAVALAAEILEAQATNRQPKSIDFDDMLWLTLLWKIPFSPMSFIFLDETQDTNGVQRELLRRMLGPASRLVAVGDPHQSIYAFRGADSDAMTALREAFAMTELKLSVSYRCSQSGVKEAQKYVGLPHEVIQPHPNAPLGSVLHLDRYAPGDFPADAAVLCRNTAPLVSFAFDLLRRSVACHIVGRDIQVGLEKLIEKVGGTTIPEFRSALASHSNKECERLRLKGKDEACENYNDKCAALMAVAVGCHSVSDIKVRIAKIFASGDGITLSTIHRAKGLEWPTVFLLDWHLLPSKYAETVAERQQERNLQYVAVTRAKLDLRFITTGKWKTL